VEVAPELSQPVAAEAEVVAVPSRRAVAEAALPLPPEVAAVVVPARPVVAAAEAPSRPEAAAVLSPPAELAEAQPSPAAESAVVGVAAPSRRAEAEVVARLVPSRPAARPEAAHQETVLSVREVGQRAEVPSRLAQDLSPRESRPEADRRQAGLSRQVAALEERPAKAVAWAAHRAAAGSGQPGLSVGLAGAHLEGAPAGDHREAGLLQPEPDQEPAREEHPELVLAGRPGVAPSRQAAAPEAQAALLAAAREARRIDLFGIRAVARPAADLPAEAKQAPMRSVAAHPQVREAAARHPGGHPEAAR
jgi:hypothetical protein